MARLAEIRQRGLRLCFHLPTHCSKITIRLAGWASWQLHGSALHWRGCCHSGHKAFGFEMGIPPSQMVNKCSTLCCYAAATSAWWLNYGFMWNWGYRFAWSQTMRSKTMVDWNPLKCTPLCATGDSRLDNTRALIPIGRKKNRAYCRITSV